MRLGRFFMTFLLFVLLLPFVPATQESKPQEGNAAQAEAAKPLEIPEEEKARKNPVPSSPESAEAGRRLYRSQCAFCHGEKGGGGGARQEQNPAVPDSTGGEQKKNRPGGALFYITPEGHTRRPGQKARL